MTEAKPVSPYRLDIEQVRRWLPHRQPFLMVDRILDIQTVGDLKDWQPGPNKVGIKVTGLKNVTFNEPIFQGHFPEFAIFPGVMIIETMAQVGSFSLYPYLINDMERASGFQTILVGVDNVRFRRPVVPGDTIRVETEIVKCRGRLWVFHCKAFVDGEPVAEAEIMANMILKSEVQK